MLKLKWNSVTRLGWSNGLKAMYDLSDLYLTDTFFCPSHFQINWNISLTLHKNVIVSSTYWLDYKLFLIIPRSNFLRSNLVNFIFLNLRYNNINVTKVKERNLDIKDVEKTRNSTTSIFYLLLFELSRVQIVRVFLRVRMFRVVVSYTSIWYIV